MTPCSRRIAFGVAALAALAVFARYAVERTRGADGASWKPVAVLAWACLSVVAVAVVAAASVLSVGEVRSARERRAAWRGRPAPGEDSRPAGPSDFPMGVRALQTWGREHDEWIAANSWGVPRPRHAAPQHPTREIPVVETTAEIVRPGDGVPDHWRPPVSEPSAGWAEPPDVPLPLGFIAEMDALRESRVAVVHLQGAAERLANPAAWDLWPWESAA